MTINLSMPSVSELKPRISVMGVGGAGGNAVNNMINAELEGVDFVVTNTDAQSLSQSLAEARIQLGVGITQGLGAGSRPDIGRAAAEEASEEIRQHIQGSHMVFITAGMGGGTGTGAAPVVAQISRESGALTVGVVTKPFQFEGAHRMTIAEAGMEELQRYVDTLIIIPNQNLFRVANEKTTFAEAFKMADDVLYSGVRGVTDLMIMPGLINLDFADIRTVMMEMGKAMMGTGEAEGERRATEAAEAAISNPLLDEVSMKGARGVLINITGGLDMTLFEVDEAANRIREEVEADAHIIFGSTFDEGMAGTMRVSVVATGIGAVAVQPRPDEYRAETGNVAALDPVAAGAAVGALPGAVAPAPAARMAGAAAPAMQPVAALKHTEQTVPAAAPVADAAQALARTAPTPAENVPQREPGAEAAVAAPMPGAVRPKVDRQPFLPPQPLVADPRPAPIARSRNRSKANNWTTWFTSLERASAPTTARSAPTAQCTPPDARKRSTDTTDASPRSTTAGATVTLPSSTSRIPARAATHLTSSAASPASEITRGRRAAGTSDPLTCHTRR